MMPEIIQNILDKVNFEKKDKFEILLNKCIKVTQDHANSTYGSHHMVEFKIPVFFEGLAKISNDVTNDKKVLRGVEALQAIYEELGFEVDKDDAFILFYLRDLGKFKIKDSKLKEQLKDVWKQYKDFALDDQNFAHAIKTIRRMGLIDYRKGSLTLNQNIVVSYKNE